MPGPKVPDTEKDEELMRLLGEGRMDALGALYDRHSAALLGYIQNSIRDLDAAHDLLHDLFLAAARGARSYEYPRPVRPWLFTIARNLALNFLKKPRPRPASEAAAGEGSRLDDRLESAEPPPEDLALAEERREVLVKALDALRPAEKEVVLLRLGQGLRFGEIAAVTGSSVEAVRQRMSRAVGKLRDLMQPRG